MTAAHPGVREARPARQLPPGESMSAGKLKARARTALRWWQRRGTEVCASCGQSYHYEMEYRCVDCDRGVCAVCAVRERETVHCPECV